MNRKMPADQRDQFNRATASRGQAHKLIGFEKTEYGVIKRRLVGDETKEMNGGASAMPSSSPTSSGS